MQKSNYVVTGYSKGETKNISQVVSVGVINLSDIAHYVDGWMDKPYEVSKRDIVRIIEVRITRMQDSEY